MKSLAIKLINLFALLGAVAWFARSPDWEPAITTLVLLSTLIGQEIVPSIKQNQSEHDINLLQNFLSVFPSNGRSVMFLKDHDLGGSFPAEDLEELTEFVHEWDNAEHEFKNQKIEGKRSNLLKLSKSFRSALSLSIFSDGHGYFSMELKDFEDRPHILEKRDRLNELASKVYEAHQELIRSGNKFA